MSVRFGHAVVAEDGTNGKTGAQIGDQTGKEIAFRNWYKSGTGWLYLLVCKDENMANLAATYMEAIVADENYGYSQNATQRWSGLKAILANGRNVAGARGDFDCSTLVLSCYILAGLDHAASGYTGSMYKSLMATGMFTAYSASEYVSTGDYAQRGAIYLRVGHVAMALNAGAKAGQTTTTTPKASSGSKVPLIPEAPGVEAPYILALKNVRVRTGPSTKYGSLGYIKKGTRVAYGDSDPDTNWHAVETSAGAGFISGNAAYTELVT